MSIKNLLLAHTGSSGFPSSLRHAVKIAARHEAWLTGVYGNTSSYFDQAIGLTEDLREKLGSIRNERIEASRQLFQDEVTAAGIESRSQFLVPEMVGKVALTEIARSFDFVITGYQPRLPTDEFRAASPDLVALQSGRPVLVVPDGYESQGLADHAIVAWDGKRSAARALNDAMMILEEKPRKVSVVTVGDTLHELPPGTGILAHLERHGIQAEHLKRQRSGRKIADVIEDTATEIGAKLIVMGAYEHSKFSQDLFGGVTHQVLRSAKVPVFMSH
ncbi:Nucleotide-binding universal stress protein, UspA family [Lutimaribacter pacificus]|uniref:Nucleotide-binding universal stress protein, UspA family n=1 Tax=Lutimaribacter pacificus TaxID=391948 RepID=A0A1H0GIV8_9RHOB|nr:universal stress protein [Lutimaribacter pacificus]SDO06783.1 Nucleotide-binding universal stress protein, UspA family [Lutimaribacter pacificus]SHJ88659.1 Nucleotide-binding universal stress protein, UspA family [Lutimaribacter pacificus]